MYLLNSKKGWLVLTLGAMLLTAMPVAAYDRSALEQRRAERRAQMEERRLERKAARAARQSQDQAGVEEETCRCATRLSFSKPSLQWRGGDLQFIPRVDISIRSRGEERIGWKAVLDYAGQTRYQSDDVNVPTGVSFAGHEEIFSGQCGDNFTFSGRQLPPVSLTGLTRGLASREVIDGRVQMEAKISGCGADEENREFSFSLSDWGNLRVRGWRSVR